MSATLYVAPAGYGKTRHVLSLVREATRQLDACPRICVANRQQLVSWQHRLAAAGGCIGAHLMTFEDLNLAILTEAGQAYTQIGDTMEYRLLRALTTDLALRYYQPVHDYPGFIQECQRFIIELKSAQISPESFLHAVSEMGDPPRLQEIGQIYRSYQAYLETDGLADSREMGWLALDAITQPSSKVAAGWSLLIFDGFASFTQTQLSLLHALQSRVDKMIITLSGDLAAERVRPCQRHFTRTRQQIEDKLHLQARSLPDGEAPPSPLFARLEQNLFSGHVLPSHSSLPEKDSDQLSMVSVPDHATEVRVALRWLKQRIMVDGIPVHETSLVARDIALYRPLIALTAQEYGLPIYFVDGPPLQSNPCIAAIFALLRLLEPDPSIREEYAPALQRRALINILRSPYFDWQSLTDGLPGSEAYLQPEDIDQLDKAGRWGRVIAGHQQWREALERLAAVAPGLEAGTVDNDPDFGRLPPGLPVGEDARKLLAMLNAIIQRLTPPQGQAPIRTFIAWLEDLLGPDSSETSEGATATLNILSAVRSAPPQVKNRDIAAIRRLKDVLRGLLWGESIGRSGKQFDYTQFVEELTGATEAAGYHPETFRQSNAILVSGVQSGRGVPCRALAVMGLSEGLFPASLQENPFLREADRATLRDQFGLPLDSAIDSHEQEYFYETVTRANDWLLLTRPVLSDSGASWEPSPFWSEVERIVGPSTQASDGTPLRALAASKVELCYQITRAEKSPPQKYLRGAGIEREWNQIKASAAIFKLRWSASESPFNGSLVQHSQALRDRFSSNYLWSVSRLESYLSCPHRFFLSSVLGLEPRDEPEEGVDARQLGNIYHRIMEETYRSLPPEERDDLEALKASLDQVAELILSAAPRREGFRETPWWHETRQEIRRNVEKSLEGLAALQGAFIPTHFECFFGKEEPLALERDGERILIRGVIDRIDVNDEGEIRLIDYKTAGPYAYTTTAHREGKLLQLPLYALAAQEAMHLGTVVDGFYWHIQHGESSSFQLKKAGPEAASQTAVEHVWRATEGARKGHFSPEPPDQGCPQYCPGASFCWRYEPGRSR